PCHAGGGRRATGKSRLAGVVPAIARGVYLHLARLVFRGAPLAHVESRHFLKCDSFSGWVLPGIRHWRKAGLLGFISRSLEQADDRGKLPSQCRAQLEVLDPADLLPTAKLANDRFELPRQYHLQMKVLDVADLPPTAKLANDRSWLPRQYRMQSVVLDLAGSP